MPTFCVAAGNRVEVHDPCRCQLLSMGDEAFFCSGVDYCRLVTEIGRDWRVRDNLLLTPKETVQMRNY